MAPVAEGSAEEREVAGVDPRLDRVSLVLCQQAVRDGGIDAILQRGLQRVAERARLHAELLGGVVDDSLTLLLRRSELGRCDRGPTAGDCDSSDDCGDELAFGVEIHGLLLSLR